MKWAWVQGNWTQLKGIARTQWGRLIGDYVGVVAGNRQQLLGKTQATRAMTSNAEERQLAEWLARQHKVDPIHK